MLDLEDLGRKHALYELRKQQFSSGQLTRVGKATYSSFEVEDVAKSILPVNRLDVGQGEKAIPARYH